MSQFASAAAESSAVLQRSVSDVVSSVHPGLSKIEERMLGCLPSDAPALTEIATYTLRQGGKRIRPVSLLLSSQLFGLDEPTHELVDVGAGIEMIHMATLLHDDIIDSSPTRRSKESAYARFGLTPSLLTGDFLLVRAFGLCALLDDFVVQRTEAACVALTEGEILEGIIDASNPPSMNDYLTIISKKTASLFSLACELGAHLAGASDEQRALMRTFGMDAGVAFQMIDDILDVTADETLLGKPSGTDLRQRTPSLVNILWLESGDPAAVKFFAQDSVTAESAKAKAQELAASPIVTRARQIAERNASTALEALSALPARCRETEAYGYLVTLIEYTLKRCL